MDALLEEGGGVNKYCMDELGSYLSYIFTFSVRNGSRVGGGGTVWPMMRARRGCTVD